MQVAVGSENPVKLDATERALADLDATVEAVAVDSGVSEQPRGVAETVAGAENRARRAFETGADLGVGIEGGVDTVEGAPGLYLVMWAAVTDGERLERGGGPAIRLPEDVAARVEAGAELGPVMDDLLDTTGVARDQGAVGVFTAGGVDRTDALETAVAGALGPFRTEHF